jgi:hypothetical protein
MGEKLQNLKPHEVKSLLRGQSREAKPFTRMAKWEIRFQRFARSFRLFTPGHCCFRFRLAFSLQPLAFAIEPREAEGFLRGLPREAEGLLRGRG